MATTSFSFTSPPISTARSSPSSRFNPHRSFIVSAADSWRSPENALRVAQSSLYEVLGVRAGATCQEIKSAYRKLAKVLHPDAAGADTSGEFMLVHSAYATLSDPEKREIYDVSLFRRRLAVVAGGGSAQQRQRRRRNWETDQCW